MTKLIHREGDIFTTNARAIGHGVNTIGAMGAGIAVQFKTRFPEMYEFYRRECEHGYLTGGRIFPWTLSDGRMVYNIASQELPGANASYTFLAYGIQKTLEDCTKRGIETLALPRIGSGIGGLDEVKVENILETLALFYPTDIELWTYKP